MITLNHSAEKDINHEQMKTKLREAKSSNNLIEDLQNKVLAYEGQIKDIKQNNLNQIESLKSETKTANELNEKLNKDVATLKEMITSREIEIQTLKEQSKDSTP